MDNDKVYTKEEIRSLFDREREMYKARILSETRHFQDRLFVLDREHQKILRFLWILQSEVEHGQ